MTNPFIRRLGPVFALVIAILLLGWSTDASAKHRHGAARKASHSVRHHVKHGRRFAKLSRKPQRHERLRTLTADEKQQMIDQIRELATSTVVGDTTATSSADIEAQIAQAAKEEQAEDDVNVSLDQYFSERPGAIDTQLTPSIASERQSDFTLFDEEHPEIAANRSDVMEQIVDWIGTRYSFGGDDRTGIDCSAFTRTIMERAFGLDLPRTAYAQSQLGEPVAKSDLQFGDLVFFKTARYAPITHVGIYIGEGLFANAACSRGVSVASLSSTYWSKHYVGARRLFASNNAATSGNTAVANAPAVQDVASR